MEEFTTQDLIEELQRYHPPIEERTGGVTQQEWAKSQGIRPRSGGDLLNEMLDEGILYRLRQRCADGIVRYVYYKAEG